MGLAYCLAGSARPTADRVDFVIPHPHDLSIYNIKKDCYLVMIAILFCERAPKRILNHRKYAQKNTGRGARQMGIFQQITAQIYCLGKSGFTACIRPGFPDPLSRVLSFLQNQTTDTDFSPLHFPAHKTASSIRLFRSEKSL